MSSSDSSDSSFAASFAGAAAAAAGAAVSATTGMAATKADGSARKAFTCKRQGGEKGKLKRSKHFEGLNLCNHEGNARSLPEAKEMHSALPRMKDQRHFSYTQVQQPQGGRNARQFSFLLLFIQNTRTQVPLPRTSPSHTGGSESFQMT